VISGLGAADQPGMPVAGDTSAELFVQRWDVECGA